MKKPAKKDKKSQRVLVCGGRAYSDRLWLFDMLDDVHAHKRISCLIHGGATGADSLAGEWATERKVIIEVYPANWDLEGRVAGPLRNQRMLLLGKPDLVIAFPGGTGTAHMTRITREAGIALLEVV